MNGDNKPDLVVTAEGNSSKIAIQFSAAINPFWKVYYNSGYSFSSTASSWSTPIGGAISSGNRKGYNNMGGVADNNDASSESWSVMDMNGDHKPDLLVTAQANSSMVAVQFSPTSSAYWKVYTNSGTTAINEVADNIGARLYPNPNNGYFTFEYTATDPNVDVSVTDILGNVVYTSVVTEKQTMLDLTDRPCGMYFLHIGSQQEMKTIRFCIVR